MRGQGEGQRRTPEIVRRGGGKWERGDGDEEMLGGGGGVEARVGRPRGWARRQMTVEARKRGVLERPST